jgi:hypothetical protein
MDVHKFKTSAEVQNVDQDGLSFDSSTFDFNGRSVSAPAPTMEQSSFENQSWAPSLDSHPSMPKAAIKESSWDEQ